MISTPNSGKPFVVTVCTPSDFHKRWRQSRFRVSFIRHEGPKWLFELQSSIKHRGAKFLFIEGLAKNPLEPMDPTSCANNMVCRLIDGKQMGSEWTIANLSPDIERPEEIPFIPPWMSAMLKFQKA